jgi:hypothetical protein
MIWRTGSRIPRLSRRRDAVWALELSTFGFAEHFDGWEVLLLESVFKLHFVKLGHVGDAKAHFLLGDIGLHVLLVYPR